MDSKVEAVKLAKIVSFDPRRASRELEALAHKQGDSFAIKVLEDMSPLDVAAVFNSHDFSFPTVAHWLAKPENIVAAMRAEPGFWTGRIAEFETDDLFKIARDAHDFLYALIMDQYKERQLEILKAIFEDEEGAFLYLILAFGSSEADPRLLRTLEDAFESMYPGDSISQRIERLESEADFFWLREVVSRLSMLRDGKEEDVSSEDVFIPLG